MNGKGNDDPLSDLDHRLKKARQVGLDARPQRRAGSAAMGIGFKIAIELVLAVLIGTGMGWFLDGWLGTSPFLLILFFFLGTGAGIMNVARASKALGQESAKTDDDGESRDENGRA